MFMLFMVVMVGCEVELVVGVVWFLCVWVKVVFMFVDVRVSMRI